ncbi:MAG: TonB-dependent receptor [Caulobacteraceae bacterium]
MALSAAAGTLLAAGARAAPDSSSDNPKATSVGEIIVTAERRSENIMKVGVNVTAISAAQLRQSRVVDATDLASLVPNFDVKTNVPGLQQIMTVRGVGLDDFSSTNNSSVGVYVDDVFLASFAEMDFGMYDLARVEVLKGPQGTLYGRNSTAGAINIISAPPTLGRFYGDATVGYGNYETFQADGDVNIPLGQTAALRLSAQTDQQERGYWFSTVLNRDLGRQNVFRERGQLLWEPTSKLRVLLKLEGEENHSEIGVGKFFGTIPVPGYAGSCPNFAAPANCVDFLGYTDTNPNPFVGAWNHLAPLKTDVFNATLHVDYDMGWAKLTSITGWIDFSRDFYIDADASPAVISEFDQHDYVKQFSQEFRLDGQVGGVQWLAGAYYSWDAVKSRTPGYLTDFLGADVFIHSDQVTRSEAVFGQVKWPLTSTLTLVTGLRGTHEERSYVGGSIFYVAGTDTLDPYFPATFLRDTISDTNLSWHVGLNWNPDERNLIYLSAAESTKSGGFFNGITTSSAALAPYKPEHLTDIEVGWKSQLFGHALMLDTSVFYYDYHDYQAQTFTSVGPVALIKLANIHEAELYGADIGLDWAPLQGLSFHGGVGLLHSWLGSFAYAATCPTCAQIQPSGNKMPDAPDVSFDGVVRYEHPLTADFVGALQFSAHYEDFNYKESLNTPFLSSPAALIMDARVSLATADRNWEMALWVKNLANHLYPIQVVDDGDSVGYRMFNNPRTYGITLTHHFR